MKILIIGSGGREHAMAWQVAQFEETEKVFVAPGNAGTAGESKVENVDIDVLAIPELIAFAQNEKVDLTIVGPEAPLVAGIVDQFTELGLACFGPSQNAAQLEGSKAFTKDFLARHAIPTAEYQSFEDESAALDYLNHQTFPIVIKADGLAAGKGVVIACDFSEAKTAVNSMLSGNRFGEAGHRVVIEEFLHGEEASFMVVANGLEFEAFATSQDHKARDDGDKGPNTGGMGAYSPAPVVSEYVHEKVIEEIIKPTLQGMYDEGNSYSGFLYAGLMIDQYGNPKVLEYNCRLGDPETQPLMYRLRSNLAEVCLKVIRCDFDDLNVEWHDEPALGVVMAAGGYPDAYPKGDVISGLEQIDANEAKVFHAGTAQEDNLIVTSGGRVLCVTARAETIEEAKTKAYANVDKIQWSGQYFRTDIGNKAITKT